jgi:nitrogen fixation protein FixH
MNTPDFGAMHIRTALILVALSIVLAISIYFGLIKAHYWVAAIPAVYAWARPSYYRLVCDATYHAHHRFEADIMEEAERDEYHRMTEAVTLDAESMLRGLHIDDQRAGRA